ncbi:MAG TPA: dephospho-CoA kinase [Draconibacterium sp.]|nr:dephospho-CoA kinase [Draconibacterium sp.]HRX10898.1 dephospho-CoA kinase [Draconibacterium sp.]
MSIKIGVTGGIGSGKTTVCEIFKLLDITVFEADRVAKELMNSNVEVKNELILLFGDKIYGPDKKLNRKMLADLIFNDESLLEKVNNLVHPAVRNEFILWHQKQNSEYVVHEAAILFESGFYKMMDFTILVSAPKELRIERVVKRNKIPPELVESRINKQWNDEDKRKLASFELVNDNKHLLIPQILEIDKKLKTDGKIW